MTSLYGNLNRWRPSVVSILRIVVVALLFLQHFRSSSASRTEGRLFVVVEGLRELRGSGESYSDVILRLAKA